MRINNFTPKKNIFNMNIDSDKDGVPNFLDCEPYNKSKQGFIHRAGATIARKLGKEEYAEKLEAKGKKADRERAEEKEIYRKAREEARVKERAARIKRKEELIRTAPERAVKRKESIRRGFSKIGSVTASAGRSMAQAQAKLQKKGTGFGSSMPGFNNPLAEFSPKKKKGSSIPGFNNPLAEFSPKKKKITRKKRKKQTKKAGSYKKITRYVETKKGLFRKKTFYKKV